MNDIQPVKEEKKIEDVAWVVAQGHGTSVKTCPVDPAEANLCDSCQ